MQISLLLNKFVESTQLESKERQLASSPRPAGRTHFALCSVHTGGPCRALHRQEGNFVVEIYLSLYHNPNRGLSFSSNSKAPRTSASGTYSQFIFTHTNLVNAGPNRADLGTSRASINDTFSSQYCSPFHPHSHEFPLLQAHKRGAGRQRQTRPNTTPSQPEIPSPPFA